MWHPICKLSKTTLSNTPWPTFHQIIHSIEHHERPYIIESTNIKSSSTILNIPHTKNFNFIFHPLKDRLAPHHSHTSLQSSSKAFTTYHPLIPDIQAPHILANHSNIYSQSTITSFAIPFFLVTQRCLLCGVEISLFRGAVHVEGFC